MNSVKFICDNFKSMTDKNKITLLLYRDSRFDENKNKFIKLKDSPDPFSNKFHLLPNAAVNILFDLS